MGTGDLHARLAAVAEAAGGRGDPVVLSDRPGPSGQRAVVVRVGDVVVKAHPVGTDPRTLAARLLVVASGALDSALLAPLAIGPVAGAALGSASPPERVIQGGRSRVLQGDQPGAHRREARLALRDDPLVALHDEPRGDGKNRKATLLEDMARKLRDDRLWALPPGGDRGERVHRDPAYPLRNEQQRGGRDGLAHLAFHDQAPGPGQDREPGYPPGDLLAGLAVRVGERFVTAWPGGRPVTRSDPDAAPWEAGAELLARLHSTPPRKLAPPRGVASTLPVAGGPARVGRMLGRLAEAGLGATPAGAQVRRAAATLPGWARGAGRAPGATALTHGDWHMGQLVHQPRAGWRLVDVDDLGLGDPAWDLARPAAWYGAGLLSGEVWLRFLRAYQAAGGSAIPPGDDPWEVLDLPARALLVQSAAAAVTEAARSERALDEVEQALVDGCGRVARSVGT